MLLIAHPRDECPAMSTAVCAEKNPLFGASLRFQDGWVRDIVDLSVKRFRAVIGFETDNAKSTTPRRADVF
jgi:hypothetical protein